MLLLDQVFGQGGLIIGGHGNLTEALDDLWEEDGVRRLEVGEWGECEKFNDVYDSLTGSGRSVGGETLGGV